MLRNRGVSTCICALSSALSEPELGALLAKAVLCLVLREHKQVLYIGNGFNFCVGVNSLSHITQYSRS